MLGNSDTVVWMYLNSAPPGWKALATGADTVLGVAGGTASYNVNGGNPDSAATWVHNHTMGTHVHKVYDYIGTATQGKTHNSSGTAVNIATDTCTAGKQIRAYTGESDEMLAIDLYSDAIDPGDTTGMVGDPRPSASVGKLFQLDTS